MASICDRAERRSCGDPQVFLCATWPNGLSFCMCTCMYVPFIVDFSIVYFRKLSMHVVRERTDHGTDLTVPDSTMNSTL